MHTERIDALKKSFTDELIKLCDFWAGDGLDAEYGGVFGKCIGNDHKNLLKEDNKTAISQARALWGLSAAYNTIEYSKALSAADNIFSFIESHLVDREYGGAFSAVSREGKPVNLNKQPYGSSFIIYAGVEYYKASGNDRALELAKGLYRSFEEHCHDDKFGGYYTEFSRDWVPLSDVKTLTAQQHLMEAYAQLYTVWRDDGLKARIYELVKLCCSDSFFRLPHYYYYQKLSRSFEGSDELDPRCLIGDTAEMAWLVPESAAVVYDPELDTIASLISREMTEEVLKSGADGEFGGVLESTVSDKKVWWVLCEGINCFMYAFRNTGNDSCFVMVESIWSFCCEHLIKEDGMWFWETDREGRVIDRADRPSPVPDAYHTCRVCVRGIEALSSL